ncbi:dTDP-4-dehydrorhamnose reductase family protein [Paenibacillus sp. B01]|uniref:dTDP-4-dehydrorhamnose reductase family protein n=1 Tax=Paenibacillus sp. B01 TaxID=2660554 RepID=UPI00129BC8D4|nr:SDR family oxidoreductase [Paenibacillus sp. B01]QGG55548.1 sugar nucleotide-binding protein [Paenibacillus sp. B01]
MRLLVLGGGGMAGSMMVDYFRGRDGFELSWTTRGGGDGSLPLDASDLEAVRRTVAAVRPELIVNCIGKLNADAEAHPLEAYAVNGLLPHWLAFAAGEIGARLIHISSDCVFLGDRGGYTELDRPDGISVYARSKALGEVNDPRHLTIRTSIIGPDASPKGIGLLRWFLAQTGEVSGYSRVYWNGVTTLELAKAVEHAAAHPEIGGLVHLLAAAPASKLEMLEWFKEAYGRDDVAIVPAAEPEIDRTLSAVRTDWIYRAPSIPDMVRELAAWERRGG